MMTSIADVNRFSSFDIDHCIDGREPAYLEREMTQTLEPLIEIAREKALRCRPPLARVEVTASHGSRSLADVNMGWAAAAFSPTAYYLEEFVLPVLSGKGQSCKLRSVIQDAGGSALQQVQTGPTETLLVVSCWRCPGGTGYPLKP